MAVLMVVVVGGPIYWWRSQFAQVPKPETELQQKARLQSETEVEMLKESTNVIVGLTRIIRLTAANSEENPYKWSGDVTAEFVNRVGGIERTNIMFRFGTDTLSDGLVHLRCSCESEPIAATASAATNTSSAVGDRSTGSSEASSVAGGARRPVSSEESANCPQGFEPFAK